MKTLIAAFLLLSACANQQDKERTSQSVASPHTEADWLFEKKVRCGSLREYIYKRIEGTATYLGEIFYSPARNTCVYTTRTIVPKSGTFLTITDALTGEGYFEGSTFQNTEMIKEFDARVLELKGLKLGDPLGIR